MIRSTHQGEMTEWLCERAGPVSGSRIVCLGLYGAHGIRGVVGYYDWNGASCRMHAAGVDGNWLTRDFLFAIFHYPFVVCGANQIICEVSAANVRMIKLLTHAGFNTTYILPDAHPDGALLLFVMRKHECRFLRTNHGKESTTAPAAA